MLEKKKKIIVYLGLIFLFSLFWLIGESFIPSHQALAGVPWSQTISKSGFYSGTPINFTFNTRIKSPSYEIISGGGPSSASIGWRNDYDSLTYGAQMTFADRSGWSDGWTCNICNCGECAAWGGPGCWVGGGWEGPTCRACDCTEPASGPYDITIKFSGTGPFPGDAFAGVGANTGVTTGAVSISESQITFNWSLYSLSGPTQIPPIHAQNGLWFQVDDNSDFSSPILDTGAVSLTDKFLSISKPSPGTYYWRIGIRASNYYYWTPWAYDSFHIPYSPDIPTLIVPPDNTWITYNPTFQARVTDTDSNVSADFNVSGYGDGLGNQVSSGSISSWGPVSIPDGTYSWRARGYDGDVYGDYSGYWTLKKDATLPSASLDQPNGTINQTSFTITLTESDALSGVSTGDVDVRINGGSWQNYSNTTSDFTYDGSAGNTYEFRYQVQDNAGNWSGFAYDGSVYINRPPQVSSPLAITPADYCGGKSPNNIFLNWTFTDLDGDSQEFYQIEVIRVSDTTTATGSKVNSSAVSIPVFAVNSDLASLGYGSNFIWYDPNGLGYVWKVKVWDSSGGESNWSSNDSFDTTKHQWPSISFNWSPQEPSQEENVLFADQSTVYGGATKSSWSWTFVDGNPASSNVQNPIIQFTTIGDHLVTLGVRDSDGFYCPGSRTVSVQIKLPGWKEVLPW